METPTYIGLSRQTALRRQLDIVANNIANMNTTGFKGQRTLFVEHIDRPDEARPLSLVNDYGSARNLGPGPLEATDNPFDLALRGDGYFVVEGPGREAHYTRNGNFHLSPDEEMVDANGYPVLDQDGQPIQLPPGVERIDITERGDVSADGVLIARLDIARFEDEQAMKEVGRSLLTAEEPPKPALEARVLQGRLERSNVDPVVEMTRMIDVQRAYQSTQRMLSSEHDRQRQAIRRLMSQPGA